MTRTCDGAVSSYISVIEPLFKVVPGDEGCLVVTPFLRSDNESIELELLFEADGRVRVTDKCDTVDYLFVNGLNVRRRRGLREKLDQIGKRFGVEISKDEISKVTDLDGLGKTIYSVLNAVQDASYLIYRREVRAPSSFDEEVEKHLMAIKVAYDTDYQLKGKAREHNFRYHVNSTGHKLVEPLTATTPHAALVKAERLAFWWVDISEQWRDYFKVAVLDDTGQKEQLWIGRPLETLKAYSDDVIPWSRRERLSQVLSPR